MLYLSLFSASISKMRLKAIAALVSKRFLIDALLTDNRGNLYWDSVCKVFKMRLREFT